MPTVHAADRDTNAMAPFRSRLFRAMWFAGLGSNVGTSMHALGASWVMTELTTDPATVAALQTAALLPALLLSVPAGALVDVVNHRRLLLVTQTWMLLAAAALAVLRFGDLVTPPVLLALTALMGIGSALNLPAYVALTPQLVPRSQLQQASALNSASGNLAQAAGPAVAGLLIARAPDATVFAVNAASFVFVIAVLARWRPEARDRELPAERLGAALRSGWNYVRHTREFHAVLVRAAAYFLPASALMSLLPVLGRRELGLTSSGLGLLYAGQGAGAVAGAFLLGPIARRLGADLLVVLMSLVVAASVGVVAVSDNAWVTAAALVAAGAGGLSAFSTLMVTTQTMLSSWVRGRGLSAYLLTFQGSLAVGSLVWGAVASNWSTRAALAAAAFAIAVGSTTALWFRLVAAQRLDIGPITLPTFELPERPDDRAGPVHISIEYDVAPEDRDAFVHVMSDVRTVRLRTGAYGWHLTYDAAAATRIVEHYSMAHWVDYLRQRSRATASDGEAVRRAYALSRTDYPNVTRHIELHPGGTATHLVSEPEPVPEQRTHP